MRENRRNASAGSKGVQSSNSAPETGQWNGGPKVAAGSCESMDAS